MAAVGAEVTGSWFLSSGPVGFFILLLLLSIFLTALCSDCRRRSFELRDPEADRNPSSLVRVVRLEEAMGARENPMIDEIQKDEAVEENAASFTPWRSHLGAPQDHQGVHTNGSAAVMKTTGDSETEENAVPFTPWRSHLMALQSRDWHSSTPPDSAHIYHVIGGRRSSGGGSGDADASSPPTNHEAEEEHSAAAVDRNSVYARVSKKARPTTPPAHTPEEEQEEEEQEEASPPLPDRKTQLEG